MRWAFALGLVALFACGGDPTTSPDSGAISLSKKSTSTLLPSATNPSVQAEFVCGPSYPTDGGVAPGWCTDLIQLVWLQPSGKHQWIFGWKVGGEFPGDTLFFHCNLLHRSDQNRSERPRWSMICCYNAARNNPYKESHHPRYTPLQTVPDSAIKTAGLRRFSDPHTDVAWMDPEKDVSARSLEK